RCRVEPRNSSASLRKHGHNERGGSAFWNFEGCHALWALVLFLPTLLLLGAVTAVPARAQVTGGVIHGIVTDPQNAPMPDVEVTISNAATGVTVSTKTN